METGIILSDIKEIEQAEINLNKTSLEIVGKLLFDKWLYLGEELEKIEGAVHWWIGDWLNYGENNYGETYSQAMDITGFDYETLRADKWVSEKIETVRRRTVLSWAHHKELASLEPLEQDKFLDLAEMGDDPSNTDEHWSRSRLRQEINKYKRLKELLSQEPSEIIPDDNIILGDCTQIEWPDNIDLIIADPPYGLSADDTSGVREHKGEWDDKEYTELHAFNMEWLKKAIDALKDNGTIFVFGSLHNIFSIGHILKAKDCYLIRDIVWNKPFVQRQVNLGSLVPSHELIIWARKGDKHRCYLDEITRDVWDFQPSAPNKHPTEKPVNLIHRLISMASDPGDLIVDPFLGSGTTTAVAKQLKRNYFGVEKDEYWWKIATERTRNS